MVGPSTRLALKRRAVSAADWLVYWEGRLQDEIKKQNIERPPQQRSVELEVEGTTYLTTLSDDPDDDLITITLKRGVWRDLFSGMHEHAAEIRRFANWK
jgi:hypothetical protein